MISGNCYYTNNMAAAYISSYKYINGQTQGINLLAESIADNGPHAISLFSNGNFQRYSSGIFDDPSCDTSTTNHIVISVGYNMDEGYWLFRNSWSASWGEDGHMKMKMGSNTCNCERYAWIPFVWTNSYYKSYKHRRNVLMLNSQFSKMWYIFSWEFCKQTFQFNKKKLILKKYAVWTWFFFLFLLPIVNLITGVSSFEHQNDANFFQKSLFVVVLVP